MIERRVSRAWKWLKHFTGLEPERRQYTYCYCKNCRNELCGDPATKVYEAGSEVHFICGKCNWQTDFLFDAPVPIYLRSYAPGSNQFVKV